MLRYLLPAAMSLSSAAAEAVSTLVTTPLGKVQGYTGANDTLIWRGIPYAEAPTGPNRWRSPKPAKAWTTTLKATQFAADCAQFGPAWTSLAPRNSQAPCHNNMKGCVNRTWSNSTSEDCLYANVYSSAAPAPAPRPVIVYFAAGALEWGAGNDLENSGEGLGAKPGWKDVILVTLNYRKGIFGFLASDELKARDEKKTAGVFGLQDQTMALKWVQANIAAFGGDPKRVTLFGESAGATSVSLHMVMPESQGTFHGAIMDSGSFNQWTYRPWSDATDLYKVLVKQLGCDAWPSTVDCMLSKDTSTLLNVSDTYYGNCSLPHKESIVTTQWAPAMDGSVIPGEPVSLLLAGKAASVPVLIGSNKNEGSTFLNSPPRDETGFYNFFNTFFGNTSGPAAAAAYLPPNQPPAPSPSPGHHGYGNMAYHDAAQDAAGDFDLRCPTRMAARVFASQGRPTFLYSYDHPPYESVNEGMPIRSTYLGAFHGSEVPFVFYDDFELVGSELDLSSRMATYWTTFAATGNPNPKAAPDNHDDGSDGGDESGPAAMNASHTQAFTCDRISECQMCGEYGQRIGCVWCPTMNKCEPFATRPVASCPNTTCISPNSTECAVRPTRLNCKGGHPYPSPPPPPAPCSTTQPAVVWPEFGASDGGFLRLDVCNVTVQRISSSYREPQCTFWEKTCANPKANLSMACAFNRTGPFPSPP